MAGKRIAWVDAAKGVAMLAVIVGHTAVVPTPLHGAAISLHIPLFFMLAGYTFKPRGVAEVARKSVTRLLVPWLMLSLVALLPHCTDPSADGVRLIAKALFYNLSWSDSTTVHFVGMSWFHLALFVARIMLAAVLALKERAGLGRLGEGVAAVVALLGGAWLARRIGPMCPLNLTAATVGMGFMLVGHLYATMDPDELPAGRRALPRMLLAAVAWALCVRYSGIDMGVNQYVEVWPLGIAGAIAAAYLICSLCRLAEDAIPQAMRPLNFTGRHSMTIYTIHAVDSAIPWGTLSLFSGAATPWPVVLLLRIAVVVGIAASLV